MIKNVEILRGSERGKDIYVVGSGSSIDRIPDSFWHGKITVGVNFVFERVPCKYTVCHHYKQLQTIIDTKKTICITSKADTCIIADGTIGIGIRGTKTWWHNDIQPKVKDPKANRPLDTYLTGDYYWYKHQNQTFTIIDLSVFDEIGYLTAGGTITTSAIHFAYLLGAKNIFLVGVDGGELDARINFAGDRTPTPLAHMVNVQPQLEEISNFIREKGIPVMSINPFINFTLEGIKFRSHD